MVRFPFENYLKETGMSDISGVNYTQVDQSYFDKRGLRRPAGGWAPWGPGGGGVVFRRFCTL